MGSGTFDAHAYASFTRSTAGKSTAGIYTSKGLDKDLDPKGVKLRESRDSKDNPNSTPIIVALDVTGSMGMLADVIAREGLGTLFKEILDEKPVSDPHLMFMALGDAACDQHPLQVSQFEADNRIVDQLTKIFLEGGGGGNQTESYDFPWYFAARHTEHDSLIVRAKKGYLFTVGDEQAPAGLTKAKIKEVCGDGIQSDLTAEELLAEVQRKYEVFHIMIAEGDFARRSPDSVKSTWKNLLGQRAIWLDDHKKLAETIVAAISVTNGSTAAKAAAKFGKSVHEAVKGLPRNVTPRLSLKAAKS
jgi:hypothetical protein